VNKFVIIYIILTCVSIYSRYANSAPFIPSCSSTMYIIRSEEQANSQLSFVDVQSAAIKFPLVNIGGLANIRYNAAGLNPLDGYIYAIDVGSGGKK